MDESPQDASENTSESDSEEKLATKVRSTINKMTRNLSQMVRENPNTEREIEDLTDKLRSMDSQLLTSEMQEVLQTKGNESGGNETLVPVGTGQSSDAEAAREEVAKTKVGIGTQTETRLAQDAGSNTKRVAAQDV